MSTEIGKAHVKVTFDTDEAKQQVSSFGSLFTGKWKGIGKEVTGDVDQMTGGLLGRFSKLGPAMTNPYVLAGAAAVGVGVALYKVGQQFEEANHILIERTGASGKALEDLEGNVRNVSRGVPEGLTTVADALAGVRQRTDLTGKPLEGLTRQFLDFSRVTKTDVGQNVHDLTATFSQWGIPAAQMGTHLNEVLRASQATGIGVGDLSSALQRSGPSLRGFGMSFEQGAALMAGFDKAGIDTGKTSMALTHAMSTLSKEGKKNLPAALDASIKSIRGAKTESQATAEAVKLFGARAGPQMADAIRSGRFEVDKLTKTIKDGKETTADAAQRTRSFGDNWRIIKNNVLVGLQPVATALFDAINKGMTALADATQRALPHIQAFFRSPLFQASMKAAGDLIAGTFRIIVDSIKVFVDVLNVVVDLLTGKWAKAVGGLKTLGRDLVSYFTDPFKAIARAAAEFGTNLAGFFKKLPGRILGALGNLGALLVGKARDLLNGFLRAAQGAWNTVVAWLRGIPGRAVAAVGNLGGTLAAAGSALLAGLGRGISGAWGSVTSTLRGIPGRAVSAVGDLSGVLFNAGASIIDGLTGGIVSKIGSIVSAMGKVTGAITSHLPHSPAKVGPLSGAGDPARSGEAIANMLAAGMTKGVPAVNAASAQLAGAAAPTPSLTLGGFRVPAGAGAAAALAGGSSRPPLVVNQTLQALDVGVLARKAANELAWAQMTGGAGS